MFDRPLDLIVQFIHLFKPFVVITCYERGVILRWGIPTRDLAPGFHWMWPFGIETYTSANVVPETMIIGPQSLTTKDDVSVVVACLVTFQIDNVRKFLLEIEGAHQVIEDSAIGTVSHFIIERSWEQLRKPDMGNE